MGPILNWASVKPFEGVKSQHQHTGRRYTFAVASYHTAPWARLMASTVTSVTSYVHTRNRSEHIGSNQLGEFINPALQYFESKSQS